MRNGIVRPGWRRRVRLGEMACEWKADACAPAEQEHARGRAGSDELRDVHPVWARRLPSTVTQPVEQARPARPNV